MPKVLAVDHLQLAMPLGEERLARSFYAGVLGLDEIPKPANLVTRGGVWFRCGAYRCMSVWMKVFARRRRRTQPLWSPTFRC